MVLSKTLSTSPKHVNIKTRTATAKGGVATRGATQATELTYGILFTENYIRNLGDPGGYKL